MWETPQNKLVLLYVKRRFFLKKYFGNSVVEAEPHFDPIGRSFFENRLRNTSSYLEYGSGGSTLLAARLAASVVSVESDRVFADAVRRAVNSPGRKFSANVDVIHANIGLTEEWGYPVFTTPTRRRVHAWQRYVVAPWARHPGFSPDTVLVDGRFRVACALETLLRCGPDTCILVDDYTDRRSVYGPIERHAELVATHGRMAQFRKKPDFHSASCRDDQNQFLREPV